MFLRSHRLIDRKAVEAAAHNFLYVVHSTVFRILFQEAFTETYAASVLPRTALEMLYAYLSRLRSQRRSPF